MVRTARTATAVIAALLIVVGLITPTSTVAATTPAVASVQAAVAIDNTNRASVRDAYLQVVQPALAVPVGWVGNVAGCSAGSPSAASQTATLDVINFVRELAQLPGVTFNATYAAQAQTAALMMAAAGQLSHDPDGAWPCYTADGALAASKSLLSLGTAGARSITSFMTDSGVENTAVGHRRWLLYPNQVEMGNGSVHSATDWSKTSDALYVLGTFGPRPVDAPTWSPWPTAGYFPAQLEPFHRWSLSRAGADFTNATVTVTKNGTPLPVTVHPVTNGYGDNTLVWEVDPAFTLGTPDQTYDVSVSGIAGIDVTTHSYTVTLFDVNVTKPGAPTAVTATAGNAQATISWSPPSATGNAAITGYTVTASPGGHTCTWTAGPRTCTVSGLTNEISHTFTVRATNFLGQGPSSAASSPVVPSASVCGPSAPGPFTDVGGTHAFCTAIAWVSSEAIASGYADGTFRPSAPVARQALASFLWKFAGSPTTTLDPPFFADVGAGNSFYPAIQWMAESGLSTGSPNPAGGKPLFKPTDTVSRQALAAFLWRYDESTPTPPGTYFADVGIGHPFNQPIEWMAASGLSTGSPNPAGGKPLFKPTEAVSRQAMAAFLQRFDEHLTS